MIARALSDWRVLALLAILSLCIAASLILLYPSDRDAETRSIVQTQMAITPTPTETPRPIAQPLPISLPNATPAAVQEWQVFLPIALGGINQRATPAPYPAPRVTPTRIDYRTKTPTPRTTPRPSPTRISTFTPTARRSLQ